MNALWINRMSEYKHSPLAVTAARALIHLKIDRQQALLHRYSVGSVTTPISQSTSIPHVLLAEARAAKQYWKKFRDLLPIITAFPGRKPHAKDTTNALLDIGYSHLRREIVKICGRHNIPTDLAIMHVAHQTDSTPLAYDLMELFRADVVDAEVLRWQRLKKHPRTVLTERDIAHFLHEVNERLERKYYLRDFKMCHTYRYYMEVQIEKFVKAINHRESFVPLKLPKRHETRCTKSSP